MQAIAQLLGDEMMKKYCVMKTALIMFLILTMTISAIPVSLAESKGETLEVIIHYHRFDGNYEGWNIWLWAKGKDGQAYAFLAEDDYGKKAEITLDQMSGVEEIGIIIRKGEWEAKDVDKDRFVSLEHVNSDGKLEIFLVQGAEPIYFSESEMDLSPKFLKASFIDETTIKLLTSKPITKTEIRNAFSVASAQNILKPTAVSAGSGEFAQEFVVILDGGASITETYFTAFSDYAPIQIEMSGLYDSAAFKNAYAYEGDLGAIYTKQATTFKVWSPIAAAMTLNLYDAGNGGEPTAMHIMEKNSQGVWTFTQPGDLNGTYYTFTVEHMGQKTETYDPYAKAAGVNGDRSMVIDFTQTEPESWQSDKGPDFASSSDIIVYEMHIRDLSIHAASNITHKGKYLGVVEKDTKTDTGVSTGLEHLKELGITHVQILPMYDFNSIDETRLDENIFNWGYDPKNYSVPEGSYATDPYQGEVRIKEMRQMISGLHEAGIGVIMDVVYNHTALSADSNLSILMPNYYYRMVDGKYSNASGTGNETASERAMVRKLMLDSLKHWVTKYHIDGFRFDLMGVHDIETMNIIDAELRKINPNIILYGEGWTGGSSPLPEGQRLVKKNILKVARIGAFNDDFRDGVKGHVFNANEGGFVGGVPGLEESVKFGIVGAVYHPQIAYDLVNYSKAPWANTPAQSVNYVSAHDNLTLWDKLMVTNPDVTDEQRIAMHKLSNAIVLTSQGMPFLHAGVDFLRTKGGDHNSYKSPDEVNWIDWTLKEANAEVFEYYKGLIALRKAYPAFRLRTQEEIETHLTFYTEETDSAIKLQAQMIGYEIAKESHEALEGKLIVLFNGSLEAKNITLPKGQFKVLANHDHVDANGTKIIRGGSYKMPASSTLILEATSKSPEVPWIKMISYALALMLALLIINKMRRKRRVDTHESY